MIRAEGVSRRFGDEAVFADVSVGADAGETLAVIGPSGAGKTTLLRLLALFEPPDEGRVVVAGTDPWTVDEDRRRELRRRVSMVFQRRSLFTASVADNAAYGLRVRRSWGERVADAVRGVVGDSEPPAVVEAALEAVGLGDRLDAPAGDLSAGEAQRVAFARALAVDPDVLLLDEPTSNLDPRNTAVIERSVRAAADRGIAVVLATHDMAQARRVADRTAVVLGGACIETGATDAVFESPSDDRTRAFVEGELVY